MQGPSLGLPTGPAKKWCLRPAVFLYLLWRLVVHEWHAAMVACWSPLTERWVMPTPDRPTHKPSHRSLGHQPAPATIEATAVLPLCRTGSKSLAPTLRPCAVKADRVVEAIPQFETAPQPDGGGFFVIGLCCARISLNITARSAQD
jgi:hypothetical protein